MWVQATRKTCTEGCQCNGCVNLPHRYSQTRGHIRGQERDEDRTDNADSEDYDSAVEYDSDANLNEEEALDAEVSDIMHAQYIWRRE